MLRALAAFAVAFVLSLYTTPLMRKAALQFGILDKPNRGLKDHSEAVPYLGGLAVFLAFLIALVMTFEFSHAVLGILLSGTLMLLLGLVDDLGVLSPFEKLCGQLLAVIALIKAGLFVKLTFLPFLVKAVVAALKRHPRLNSVVDEGAMEHVIRHNYDIGIAISTDAGLMVCALRDADRLSIVEIAKEIERLGGAAKAGKVQKEDLGGTSFTISSLGKLGGLMAPPIINYPEVGIMGVHAMKRKPVVKGDQIVIGDVMNLSFSFDHRIIDGDVGAGFAQEIIGYLENPDRLLVEMS